MKTITLSVLIILTSIITKAQFSITSTIGYSNKKSPTAELKTQYTYQHAILSTGFLAHISNNKSKGTIFYIQSGYQFNINDNTTIEPTIGYSYNLNSTDNKNLNKKGIINSISLNKKLQEVILTIGINITNYNIFIVSTGIKYNF